MLPAMLDEFMAHKDRVVQHPRLKGELHAMRIAGKPLRYAMEIFEPAFGKEYKECFEEVKHIIEMMGDIHDCDVARPVLQNHLQEIRIYNQLAANKKDRILTRAVRDFLRQKKEQRDRLFAEMCRILLEMWTKEPFKDKLIRSML